MATKQSTMDFLEEQIAAAGNIRCRKMFGEYGVYCDGKIVALICDDRLFIKSTETGTEFTKDKATKAPPYPGAKDYLLISEDYWDDSEWLSELIKITADSLPLPKPKRLKES